MSCRARSQSPDLSVVMSEQDWMVVSNRRIEETACKEVRILTCTILNSSVTNSLRESGLPSSPRPMRSRIPASIRSAILGAPPFSVETSGFVWVFVGVTFVSGWVEDAGAGEGAEAAPPPSSASRFCEWFSSVKAAGAAFGASVVLFEVGAESSDTADWKRESSSEDPLPAGCSASFSVTASLTGFASDGASAAGALPNRSSKLICCDASASTGTGAGFSLSSSALFLSAFACH